MKPQIILASSSPFRRALFERLQIAFEVISPDIDESLGVSEDASSFVCRLAEQKARVVAKQHPHALVVGSDQCALLQDRILGKPGSDDAAFKQLQHVQGQTLVFHTGLCVLQQSSGFCEVDDIQYEVSFRQLTDKQLRHYLQVEPAYQCVGGFQSEAYGISLLSRMQGDDPTALIGLPLVRLVRMLESAGVTVV